jgi:hypothetical protein
LRLESFHFGSFLAYLNQLEAKSHKSVNLADGVGWFAHWLEFQAERGLDAADALLLKALPILGIACMSLFGTSDAERVFGV